MTPLVSLTHVYLAINVLHHRLTILPTVWVFSPKFAFLDKNFPAAQYLGGAIGLQKFHPNPFGMGNRAQRHMNRGVKCSIG